MKNYQNFSEKLRASTEETGSIISCGFDPAPIEGISGYDPELPNPMGEYDGKEVEYKIINYLLDVSEEIKDREEYPAAFKPNLGYFVMYDNEDGNWGTQALDESIQIMRDTVDVPIILDAKDADIARSSAAYGISKLKKDVNAMTVHPEMGTDSVEPFLQLAEKNNQGVYILTRTSNPGAKDFQTLDVLDEETGEKRKLYQRFAEKVVDWAEGYPDTVGSVVGATSPEELHEIAEYFHEETPEGEDVPLLIPGVGTQGGTAKEVVEVLTDVNYDLGVVRINSSSGIMYRAQKDGRPREEHAKASVDEIDRLNEETDEFL